MLTTKKPAAAYPLFPMPLSLPFKLIPASLHSRALVTALNKIFHDDIEEGELDFLEGKVIQVVIEDASIVYQFTLVENKLIASDENQTPDLFLKGTVYNYLLLASRKEDTDTLFFSRRLHMQGDTELGLYVKNFLDGLDMSSHKIPAYMESLLHKSLPIYERLFR